MRLFFEKIKKNDKKKDIIFWEMDFNGKRLKISYL
jgi:hypothetical protein